MRVRQSPPSSRSTSPKRGLPKRDLPTRKESEPEVTPKGPTRKESELEVTSKLPRRVPAPTRGTSFKLPPKGPTRKASEEFEPPLKGSTEGWSKRSQGLQSPQKSYGSPEVTPEEQLEDIVANTYRVLQTTKPYVYIDVISLYPFVCSERPYPTGEISRLHKSQWNDGGEEFISKYLFIVHCEVTQTLDLPAFYLPQRDKDKPLDWTSPLDPIECWLPSPTYIDCIKNGYTIEAIEDSDGYVGVMWQTQHFVFRKYMTTFMKMKLDEDALPVEKRNNAKREMAKLMLNAVTGKVIQKRHNFMEKFYTNSIELLNDMSKIPEEEIPSISFDGLESGHSFVKLPKKQPATSKIPSYLGVFIYAYARSYMWGTVFFHTHYIYTDTDSAVIPIEHFNKLKQAGLIGSKLGQFKEEGTFDYFIIAAPKMYIFHNTKTGAIQARCKGVGAKDTFTTSSGPSGATPEGKIITYGGNELIFFKQLMKDKKVDVNSQQFRKNVKTGIWQHINITKTIIPKDSYSF